MMGVGEKSVVLLSELMHAVWDGVWFNVFLLDGYHSAYMML